MGGWSLADQRGVGPRANKLPTLVADDPSRRQPHLTPSSERYTLSLPLPLSRQMKCSDHDRSRHVQH
ncbi:unnamed protein product [Gadus morhua 'NCC']